MAPRTLLPSTHSPHTAHTHTLHTPLPYFLACRTNRSSSGTDGYPPQPLQACLNHATLLPLSHEHGQNTTGQNTFRRATRHPYAAAGPARIRAGDACGGTTAPARETTHEHPLAWARGTTARRRGVFTRQQHLRMGVPAGMGHYSHLSTACLSAPMTSRYI